MLVGDFNSAAAVTAGRQDMSPDGYPFQISKRKLRGMSCATMASTTWYHYTYIIIGESCEHPTQNTDDLQTCEPAAGWPRTIPRGFGVQQQSRLVWYYNSKQQLLHRAVFGLTSIIVQYHIMLVGDFNAAAAATTAGHVARWRSFPNFKTGASWNILRHGSLNYIILYTYNYYT